MKGIILIDVLVEYVIDLIYVDKFVVSNDIGDVKYIACFFFTKFTLDKRKLLL